MDKIFTTGEVKAWNLLGWHNLGRSDGTKTYNDAGNEVILLAERIKAERAVIAMQK